MNILTDFQMELISQTSIVHYIEYRFEKELDSVLHLLDIEKIPESLYDDNSSFMGRLTLSCNAFINKTEKAFFVERPIPDWVKTVSTEEPLGDLLNYCIESLDEGALVFEKIKNKIIEVNEEFEEISYDFTDEQINEVIEAANIIYHYCKNKEFEEQIDKVNLLKTTIKLVDNSSSSNIFRQSFINAFSIFDAYVFDFLKEYFYRNPDKVDSFFGIKNNDKIKVSLEEVISFSDIDSLKNDMIRKQFAGKYLREIIYKLHSYDNSLFDGIKFNELMELIERRNVHLHNKGFVDSKYCSKYNLNGYNVGDYAFIDSKYLFIRTFNTLSNFITNLNTVLR